MFEDLHGNKSDHFIFITTVSFQWQKSRVKWQELTLGHIFQNEASSLNYLSRCFLFPCAWTYSKYSCVIRSKQITALAPTVSAFFSQVLLKVIVPCLMFMMSWLVLFSGVLLRRACSPAVVKARLTVNPLCLSRQQQTDWSGLAEACTVRWSYSTLATGQQSSSYTRVMSEDTKGCCLINMELIHMKLAHTAFPRWMLYWELTFLFRVNLCLNKSHSN